MAITIIILAYLLTYLLLAVHRRRTVMQLVFQWSYEPSVSAVECFQQHQPA